jgi:hypothetical protein
MKIHLIDIFDSEVSEIMMQEPVFNCPARYIVWGNVNFCNFYFTNSASKEYCNEN